MASIMDSISEYNPDSDDDDGDEQPDPKQAAVNINKQYIELYLEHCVKERSIAKLSYVSYRRWAYRFLAYLTEFKPGLTLLTLTKNDVLDYKYCIEKNYNRTNSAASWMGTVRNIFIWMEENQHIDINPYPSSLVIKARPPKNILVPTPEQIFLVRRKVGVKLEQAAVFEVLLSTGIRHSELRQLRPTDIAWNERPRDCEANGGIGAPSEYFLSTVKLAKERMILKSLEHKTYLSKIAVKMLLLYMAKFKIHQKSDVYLFPYSENCIGEWLKDLGIGIINSRDNLHTTSAPPMMRDPAIIVDDSAVIDVDSGMSDAHKKQLRITQERMDRHNAKIPKEIIAREKKQIAFDDHAWLHPHSLRHFCVCYNYYRNFFGERQNEIRLPRFFGHSRMATTVQTYLISLDVVHTDKEWKQIANGHPFDWLAVK